MGSKPGWIPKGESGPCADCGTVFVAERRDRLCCSVNCARRYARKQRSYVRVPLEERFWRYVTAGDPDACWEWKGFRDHRGYGRLQSPGQTGPVLKAHRVSYELHNGTLNPEAHVLHQCDNPPCVNPAHLRAGTHQENMREARERGRIKPKFSDDVVREVYRATWAGVPAALISARYGISESQVYNIRHRRQRTDVLPGTSTTADAEVGAHADGRLFDPASLEGGAMAA